MFQIKNLTIILVKLILNGPSIFIVSESNQIFTLVINGQPHQFDCNTFSKVSTKAQKLVQNGIYSSRVNPILDEEAATAFVLACNLERFTVTTQNAYDLLDLAEEWKIKNLSKFVKDYIAQKNIERQRPPLVFEDPLADLLENQKLHKESTDDIIQVAKIFNKVLERDELLQVNVDNLCEIVHYADQFDEIDPQLFLDFVMKMLNSNPFAAVPLLLRLDFERLEKHHDDRILETQEVHDANIGFFISDQLTSLRNRAKRNLQKASDRLTDNAINLENDFKDTIERSSNEAKALFDERMNHAKEIVDEQRRQLEDIKSYIDQSRKRRDASTKTFLEETAVLQEEIDRQKILMDQCKRDHDILQAEIRKEIDKQVNALKNDVRRQLNDVLEIGNERREGIIKDITGPFNSFKRNFIRTKKNAQTIKNEILKTTTETQNMKAMLSAKMIQDFMRFDNFIRRTEKRFKIFDDNAKFWGLSGAEVKEADQQLKQIEKRLDKLCPIRHTLAQ